MDLMIQMKSLNCFMDDANDTLNEFLLPLLFDVMITGDDVWRMLGYVVR